MTFAILEEFWKPLLILLIAGGAWFFVVHERDEIAKLEAQVESEKAQLVQAAGAIKAQNDAISKLKAEGDEQQKTIEGLALEAQKNAGKVVTQWKTKYVPTLIPEDCSAGIAVGAANAASVARIYMGLGK